MSSGTSGGLAVGFANILGYDRLLPLVESEETYVQVPIDLAEKLGKKNINIIHTKAIIDSTTRSELEV